MGPGDSLEDAQHELAIIRSARYETLIALNRGLIVLVFLLCGVIFAGWLAHKGSIDARLTSIETHQRDTDGRVEAHNKALRSQVEWNDLILKALWSINTDPKRMWDVRRLKR